MNADCLDVTSEVALGLAVDCLRKGRKELVISTVLPVQLTL